MSNSLRNNNESLNDKFHKINSYYFEFKNNNPNPNIYELDKYNSLMAKNKFNKRFSNIQKYNNTFLNVPFNKEIKYEDENNNYNSNDFYKNVNDEKILIKRKDYNKNRNLNIKNYSFINNYNDDIYEEYIIDYKAGLNHYDLRTKKIMNNNNDISFQNNKKINDNPNKTYNKVFNYNKYKNNNLNEITQYKNMINKNNTYDYFYKLKTSKNKQINKYLNIPYKKRIVNDYISNDSKKNTKNNININQKLLNNNNIFVNNIKIHKIINNNYQTLNIENGKNLNNNNEILKKIKAINIAQKPSMILTKNAALKKESLNKIEEFMNHFSKYCMVYYYKIIKHLFSSLRMLQNAKKGININKNKIPFPPFYKAPLSSNNKTENKRFLNISERKSQVQKITNNILIDRIRTKNESKSPNENRKEMYRNVSELSKKCEIISKRRNRINNSSLKRIVNDISFNNEQKSINEFRFSSVEKNREKMENTMNKERERKKKINQRKKSKENENKEVLNLIQKNNNLKNKIKNLEKKNKKTIEVNWNLDSISIKPIEKKDENNKDGKIYSLYNGKSCGNNVNNKNENLKMNNKYDMINIKNITTKDKSIHININYFNYIPSTKKNRNEANKDYNLYQIYNNCSLSFFGNKNKNSKIGNEKIIYHNELTSIKEEENKVYFSENISQSSMEKEYK